MSKATNEKIQAPVSTFGEGNIKLSKNIDVAAIQFFAQTLSQWFILESVFKLLKIGKNAKAVTGAYEKDNLTPKDIFQTVFANENFDIINIGRLLNEFASPKINRAGNLMPHAIWLKG